MRVARPKMKKGDDKRIRHAFEIALDAHKHMRRKSGEPIHHPLAAKELFARRYGLGHYVHHCAFCMIPLETPICL